MTARKSMTGLFALVAAAAAAAACAEAQDNPRFGVWRMDSDRPAPYENVMTYEPYETDGMRITVATTTEEGESSEWGYVTLFDGEFRPVEGQQNSETAVEVIDDRSTRIFNSRNGQVYQVIINTLSDDGNTIYNEYVRLDDEGVPVSVSHAVYRRVE